MPILQSVREKIEYILKFVRTLNKKQKIVALSFVLLIFILTVFLPERDAVDIELDDTRSVSLVNVGEASTESTPLEVTGSVRSLAQALLKTESQGEVVGVYRTVGEFVYAGTVIAELRNNAERAAVLQAQAGLERAKAALAKGTGGVRSEELSLLNINLESAENALSSSETDARNVLRSAFAAVNDAVLGSADSLFSNPESINPIFNLATSESEVVSKLAQSRFRIQNILKRQSALTLILDETSNFLEEINTTETEVGVVQDLLDDAITAVNNAIPTPSISETTISSFKTTLTTSRTVINGTLSSLSTIRNTLNNKNSALNIAKQNLELGVIGVQDEDVVALNASVKQAEAGLSLAQANLSRTLIVTPISGTINSLTLRAGDFVNIFEPAVVVSNNNALEVETYVTSADKDQIRVGSGALVSGKYKAVVTSVAPGLDTETKKIEVRIGLLDSENGLTHGSSVRVEIERNDFDIKDDDIKTISIPIKALKVETSRVIVFTVVSGLLVAHEVEPGIILGDNVVINSGLTPDMNIVVDARGLREEQKVIVTE